MNRRIVASVFFTASMPCFWCVRENQDCPYRLKTANGLPTIEPGKF